MPEEVVASETVGENEAPKPKAHKKVKAFLNKVVIRKLPPNLSSDDFLDACSPIPEYNDFYFVKADWSLGAEATSRAYIEFKHQEDIFIFKDKFDEYVFVDNVRGTEYPAIVEFAPFQNVPKKKSRKDKHVNTIDNEQHFINFMEMIQKEDSENQKPESKLEYSYQIKDDKKITSTPLLEFLAAAKEEKREAKKKKVEDRKKAREEEKHKKKLQIAKNIPEPIKETKEEIIYEDGIMVRTVPSRLGRNDKSSRKDTKNENNKEKEKEAPTDKEKERREKRDKEREERKRIQREKEEKRKQERAKEREAQKATKNNSEKKADTTAAPQTTIDEFQTKNSQPKKEVKRYSELRKQRQADTKETTDEPSSSKPASEKDEQLVASVTQDVSEKSEEKSSKTEDKDDPRWKRIRELREKREQKKEEQRKLKNEKSAAKSQSKDDEANEKRERDERAQRQIRNKDRPALQIYRPKKVESKPESSTKSSDENSESTRKRDKKSSRRNSREESFRKKKTSRKNSSNSNGDEEIANPKVGTSEADTGAVITEKLQEMVLDESEAKKQDVEE